MRQLVGWVTCSWLVTFFLWACIGICFGGCIDAPLEEDPAPITRIVIAWDPRRCGEPHRVVLELADEAGTAVSASTPCAIGMLALDADRLGFYEGRLYSWIAGEPIRSVVLLRLEVDTPLARWIVETPP